MYIVKGRQGFGAGLTREVEYVCRREMRGGDISSAGKIIRQIMSAERGRKVARVKLPNFQVGSRVFSFVARMLAGRVAIKPRNYIFQQ